VGIKRVFLLPTYLKARRIFERLNGGRVNSKLREQQKSLSYQGESGIRERESVTQENKSQRREMKQSVLSRQVGRLTEKWR
jgi:hypothetical protein